MIERLVDGRLRLRGRRTCAVRRAKPSPNTAQLSGRARDEMIAGARVEVAPYKRDPADFVLWKPSARRRRRLGQPLGHGVGRAGTSSARRWSSAHLGETIDIHGGGQDLVFPHHENEIAQSTCAHGGKPIAGTGCTTARRHRAARRCRSRSATCCSCAICSSAIPARSCGSGLLTAHYRQPLDWSEQLLAEAKASSTACTARCATPAYVARRRAPPAGRALGRSARRARGRPQHAAGARRAQCARARRQPRLERDRKARRYAEALRAGAWLLGLLEADPAEWFAGDGPRRGCPATMKAREIDALLAERAALRQGRKFRRPTRSATRSRPVGS